MNCPICGSDIRRDGEGHECGRDPISQTTGPQPTRFLEDSNGGHVDNVGTWERLHERKKTCDQSGEKTD